MATAVPSFGERQYWNDRYSENSKEYDWLNAADILDQQFNDALAKYQTSCPNVLHIGCGNSSLSFSLRLKVHDPDQIHNVDYSPVVIEWGRQRERDMFDSRWEDDAKDDCAESTQSNPGMPMMRWDEVDLLSLQSVISKCPLAGYSVVLDKSTCDSLACTSTTTVSIPYFIYADKDDSDSFLDIAASYTGTVNAVQLLAIHLALLCAEKAQWIAYSYSSTRFWFLDPDYQSDQESHDPVPLHPGLPHPRDLWTLTSKKSVVRPYGNSGETTADRAGDTHFLYVMERTAIALKVRSMDRSLAHVTEKE